MREQPRVIRWEDPPPGHPSRTRGGRKPAGRYDALAAELRAHPQRWALVGETDSWTAAANACNPIRRASIECFEPRGDFEAVARALRDGTVGIFARYLGDGAL